MTITSQNKNFTIKYKEELSPYDIPSIDYCKTKVLLYSKVGEDFIEYVNKETKSGKYYLVGLSQSSCSSGVYQYVFNNYSKINHPQLLQYTCIGSTSNQKEDANGGMNAVTFLKALMESKFISRDQIIANSPNKDLNEELEKLGKKALDYVFIATEVDGTIAGITRDSKAFKSKEISVLVDSIKEMEWTYTLYFLTQSKRIAFLATESDKRKSLAWLFHKWVDKNESFSFLRRVDNIRERMTVFIDDSALTWPQVVLTRETPYGDTTIRVDVAEHFNENALIKKPVILMVHGFLGLNTFDEFLAFSPPSKYIIGGFDYGSIPNDLPSKEFSQLVVNNIEYAVSYFGKLGHPVYVFDHSIANIYMLMIDEQMDELTGIKKYLKGRIACNPFFGSEVKHSSMSFIDDVILKSKISSIDKLVVKSVRLGLPLHTKNAVRNNNIRWSSLLIKSDNFASDRIWNKAKKKILLIISSADVLSNLNKVILDYTLRRLPAKIFTIQVQSSLRESKKQDGFTKLNGYEKYQIPTLVLKSEKDPIAKFVNAVYDSTSNVDILDVTNFNEKDVFKEHLFYLMRPQTTIDIIEQFVKRNS